MVRLPLLLLSAAALGIASVDLYSQHIATVRRIEAHNSNPNRTFSMKFNPISALSPEEYEMRQGIRLPLVLLLKNVFKAPENFTAPDSVDWRESGAVTHVKDQGNCGSCWAFSAVGALEGQHEIKGKRLAEFSEQNLVDCSSAYGNEGCTGGWPHWAFNYVKENKGIDTEESYPYDGKDEACHFKTDSVGEKDDGFVFITSGDEEALKNAVASIGPISVAIDAHHDSFKHYHEGVYYEPECTSRVTHAVLVVGYGTDSVGGDYWIVKNSWATTWGDNGYIKMARNRDNHCAIAKVASYPIVN